MAVAWPGAWVLEDGAAHWVSVMLARRVLAAPAGRAQPGSHPHRPGGFRGAAPSEVGDNRALRAGSTPARRGGGPALLSQPVGPADPRERDFREQQRDGLACDHGHTEPGDTPRHRPQEQPGHPGTVTRRAAGADPHLANRSGVETVGRPGTRPVAAARGQAPATAYRASAGRLADPGRCHRCNRRLSHRIHRGRVRPALIHTNRDQSGLLPNTELQIYGINIWNPAAALAASWWFLARPSVPPEGVLERFWLVGLVGGSFAEDPIFAFFGCAGEAGLGGVEVAFGDRGLGVAGSVLEVDVGVAGGGLVGERGMPEVVEGPEAWVDVGVVEGLAHVAGELGGVGRGACVRVWEDVLVVSLERGPLPPVGEQCGGARPVGLTRFR